MEVSITQFRRELFSLVGQAMDGREVWVVSKHGRFKIAPDLQATSRLSRITPLEVTNNEDQGADSSSQLDEMRQAWERDWADL